MSIPVTAAGVCLSQTVHAAIVQSAEAAYPEECCGLLIGSRQGGLLEISCAAASPNLAARTESGRDPRRHFEVDPAIRLTAMRQAETAGLDLIGFYHSHPDSQAVPSATDQANIWEPDLVWLIASVEQGRFSALRTFLPIGKKTGFNELPMRII